MVVACFAHIYIASLVASYYMGFTLIDTRSLSSVVSKAGRNGGGSFQIPANLIYSFRWLSRHLPS